MLIEPTQQARRSAHVVVIGNEKGGSGKSTTALHIAVALLKAGQRVATIDLDGRQKTFTHYIENRRAWASRLGIQLELWPDRAGVRLELPTHCCIGRAGSNSIEANETTEIANFSAAVSAIERSCDFLVIDTPGNDNFLMRLAHSMADTLITPINDSFLDLDVLAALDPVNFAVTGESHHARMVREARRQRRRTDGRLTDWVVVRNRLSTLRSRNKRLIGEGLTELAKRIGFRWVDGFAERIIYREFFLRGLTALDDINKATLGTRPAKSHIAARGEVTALLNLLHLPMSAVGKRRAAARAEWYSVIDQPLHVHDIVGFT